MTDIVLASLIIEVLVDCPNCQENIDLLDDDLGLNEEGAISNQALPEGEWYIEHPKFEAIFNCPKCKHKINVKGVAW